VKDPDCDIKFDVEISFDNQTLLLIQNNNEGDKCLVIIFDFYTLEKVTEMYVNV